MIADKQLTRMIEKGKPLSAIRKKAEALALAEDRVAFDVAQREEYDLLFPVYYPTEMEVVFSNGIDVWKEAKIADGFEILSIDYDTPQATYRKAIDYSEDETYLTLQEYMDETRVVQEAVEATHDEDGMVLTEAVAEVTEQVRPYIANDVADIVDAYVNGIYKELRAKEYPHIADYVDAIVKDDTEAIEAYIKACLAVKAKYPKV